MKAIPYGHQSISKKDIREVEKVLKSYWLTQGPKVRDFEKALCEYTGAAYAVAVSSGTAALHIACLAAEIGPGAEVITSPISFIATSNAVLYCKGIPVFADLQNDTMNIEPKEIEKSICKKTRAIIPVHFSGHPCDMKEIYSMARKRKIVVIEDAAHALGAEYKGTRIGSCKYSDMATFSFHPVKSITTGEGGAVLTNSRALYNKLMLLRSHGVTKKSGEFLNPTPFLKNSGDWYYEMQDLGFNYRITDFQSALGISQLGRVDEFIKRRRKIAAIYSDMLSSINEITLPIEREYVRSSWHIYCIRLKDSSKRRAIFEKLRGSGIGVQIHYIPIHLQPYYRKAFGYREGAYPIAERYYDETITLPLYPDMALSDIMRVIRTLKKALK